MSAGFLPLPHSRERAGERASRRSPLSLPSPRRGEGKTGEDWPLGVECAWPTAIQPVRTVGAAYRPRWLGKV